MGSINYSRLTSSVYSIVDVVKIYTSMFALCLCSQALFGQQDTIRHLNEVTVSYQADQATPVSYQNLDAKTLKLLSTGQEPSFILSQTPSITASSDAGSTQGYSYFRIRGIDQTRVNMTLDGVPLNEPEDQGAYFSNYPDIMNSVSKVQIQRGVGTTKNGVASYGGSVQLSSSNLYDSSRATAGVGYGSFNSSRVFAEYNSGIQHHKAFYARVSEVYSGGYKHHSTNNGQSAFLSGGLFYNKASWKMNLLVGHQQNHLAWLGVSDSLIAIDRRSNGAAPGEKDNFTQCTFQLQNSWKPSSKDAVQTSVYYTFLDGNYYFDFNNFNGQPSTSELLNYAFRSNFFGVFSNFTHTFQDVTITAGVHANTYNRRHVGSDTDLGQLYTNTGYRNEVSTFAKAEYSVSRLNFFADIQYRHTSFAYRGDVSMPTLSWDFINPKAGLSFDLANSAVIYYSIGQTGREPTRNDMFAGNDNLAADETGAPVIAIKDPEYVIDQEFGFRKQTPGAIFDVNLYYMNFDNEIVLNGNSGPNGASLTNHVDKSIRTGVELSWTQQVGRGLTLLNNTSFNYSKINEQHESFKPILTPPVIVNQEVTYQWRQFLIGTAVRYQDASYIDFANSAKLTDYVLFNARLHYTVKKFQCSFFIYNLTNIDYRANGSIGPAGKMLYFVQAPRNAYVSLKFML